MTPASLPLTLDRKLLAVTALLTALAATYSYRSADPDLWGHLQYGQFFLDNSGHIGSDPYAYTSAGRQWSTHEYLAQMALAYAYGLAGPVGLIVLKCLLGGAAIACLYCCLRISTDDPRLWAPLLMLTAVGLGRWYQFRPQLFTYLLFAFFVLTLFRYLLEQRGARGARRGAREEEPDSSRAPRLAPRAPLLWLLPLLLPLWVNLHGGFLAGIGAVGLALLLRIVQSYNRTGLSAAALWQDTWPLILTLLACFAGSLCNPLGWRLWPYLATEFGHAPNRVYLDEWRPPTWSETPMTFALLWLTLGVLLLVAVFAQARVQRIAGLAPWQWLLSCLPLTWMAFGSQRHIPIWTIWITPVLGLLAHAAAGGETGEDPSPATRHPSRAWETIWLAVTGVILIPTVFLFSVMLSDPWPRIHTGGNVLGNMHPHGVMAFLRANKLSGNLYPPLWWGSYFTWELYPEPGIRVAMDGRNVTLFAPDDVTANLAFYLEDRPDLETPLRGPADYLVVPQDVKVLPLVRADTRWAVLYEDDAAVLFVRNDDAHRDLLRRREAGELVVPEEPVPLYLK
jgi:hypothetical protein